MLVPSSAHHAEMILLLLRLHNRATTRRSEAHHTLANACAKPRRCVIVYLRYTSGYLRYLEFCIVELAILRRVTRCVTWIWAMCLSSLPGRRLRSIQGTVLQLQRDRRIRIRPKRWQRMWPNLRPLRGIGLCEVSNVLCSALLMSC